MPLAAPAASTVGPPDAAVALAAHIARSGRRMRVLFAEDNPTNQFVAVQLLKGFALQVDVAGNGLEAVAAASRVAYDVICMDMSMPEMDGLAATRAIRALAGPARSVPIIALTANAFPEDVRACLDAGMNLFVAKPVSKQVLIGTILRAVGGGAEAGPGSDTDARDAACDEVALTALAQDLGSAERRRAGEPVHRRDQVAAAPHGIAGRGGSPARPRGPLPERSCRHGLRRPSGWIGGSAGSPTARRRSDGRHRGGWSGGSVRCLCSRGA